MYIGYLKSSTTVNTSCATYKLGIQGSAGVCWRYGAMGQYCADVQSLYVVDSTSNSTTLYNLTGCWYMVYSSDVRFCYSCAATFGTTSCSCTYRGNYIGTTNSYNKSSYPNGNVCGSYYYVLK